MAPLDLQRLRSSRTSLALDGVALWTYSIRPMVVEPPPEVLKHAELIEEWAVTNGYKHWQIGPVASRKYCDVLIGNLHKARALLYKFSIRYAEAEHAKLDREQAEALIKVIDTLLPSK